MKKYQEEIEELRRMLEEADGDEDEGSDSGDDNADSDAGDVVIGGSQTAPTDTSRQQSSPTKTNGQPSITHGQSSGPTTRKVG